MEVDVIKFGKRAEGFFELSPFYYCTFVIGGKKWRTLIHYWCASYFVKSPDLQEVIRNIDKAERALFVARKYGMTDFDCCNSKRILLAIQERFNQSDGIKGILLSTGKAHLVYSIDGFLGKDNRYGRILMALRDIYATE